MALRLQIDQQGGLIYMTTLLDETPLNTTFLGASPESLESTADALYQTAESLREALAAVEKAEAEEASPIITP